jgi:hypothetical protein
VANPSSSARVRECRRKDRRGHPCARESAAVPIQPVPGRREFVRGSELEQASPRRLLPDNVPPVARRVPDSAMFPEV